MNALTVVVGIIFIIYAIKGCKKGLVEGISNIISTILGILVIAILIKGIGNFVQKSYVNVLMALILLVVIRILNRILKLVIDSLELVTKVPVVNGVNHILGMIIGILRALCLCWILLIIMGFMKMPALDEWIRTQVAQNLFLTVIYKTNIFVKLLMLIQ